LYDVLNAKIGPTGSVCGGSEELKKCSKHSKVSGDFAHVGDKNFWAD